MKNHLGSEEAGEEEEEEEVVDSKERMEGRSEGNAR